MYRLDVSGGMIGYSRSRIKDVLLRCIPGGGSEWDEVGTRRPSPQRDGEGPSETVALTPVGVVPCSDGPMEKLLASPSRRDALFLGALHTRMSTAFAVSRGSTDCGESANQAGLEGEEVHRTDGEEPAVPRLTGGGIIALTATLNKLQALLDRSTTTP